MINFKVSAPGKLNLFGENFTCEDHNGVMASINRRNTVKFDELSQDISAIILEAPDINLYFIIHLKVFRTFYECCTFDDTLSEQILEFIFHKYGWIDNHQRNIVQSFFYLLAYVTYNEKIDIADVTSFQVYLELEEHLQTETFGGFASIVVCFTTCFLHWSHLRRNANYSLNDGDRTKILMYSKSCDQIFTYCLFKSDVTVSTYGSILRYHCKDSSQNDVLDNMPRTKFLLIDSTIELNMPEIIERKKILINCCPEITNTILDSIRVTSDMAFSVLKKIRDMNQNKKTATYEQDVSAQEKKLFSLIRMQQELNNTFIVFSKQMETICEIAQSLKLSGKCADFNYARYTYIWCPSDNDTQDVTILLMRTDLLNNGFVDKNIHEIDLNNDGVKIE